MARSGPCLLAFVELRAEASSSSLRAHVAALLPAYMVPQQVHVLPALPLMPSGKLDRQGLAAPAACCAGGAGSPRAVVHRALAELSSAAVCAEASLAELGVDSVSAVPLAERLARELKGEEVPLELLLGDHKVSDLCRSASRHLSLMYSRCLRGRTKAFAGRNGLFRTPCGPEACGLYLPEVLSRGW